MAKCVSNIFKKKQSCIVIVFFAESEIVAHCIKIKEISTIPALLQVSFFKSRLIQNVTNLIGFINYNRQPMNCSKTGTLHRDKNTEEIVLRDKH